MGSIWEEDWDNETALAAPANWETSGSVPLTALQVSSAQYVSSPHSMYCMKAYTGSGSNSGYLHKKTAMPTFTDAVMEFSIRVHGGGVNGSQCSFYLNDGSYSTAAADVGVWLNAWIDGSGGSIYWRYRTSASTWADFYTQATATWIKVRIKCDTANKKFTLWVDGVKKVDAQAYWGTATEFNGILAMATTGLSSPWYMYIDDLWVGPVADETGAVSSIASINEVDLANIATMNDTLVV